MTAKFSYPENTKRQTHTHARSHTHSHMHTLIYFKIAMLIKKGIKCVKVIFPKYMASDNTMNPGGIYVH